MGLSQDYLALHETKSTDLIQDITDHVSDKKLAGKKFSSGTGGFSILSAYYKDVLGIKDPDKRDSLIGKSKDLPSLQDVVKYLDANRKKLNLVEAKTDYSLIADQLHNNEEDSDSDLVAFIVEETGADKAKVSKLIKAERSNFLGPKYSKNKTEDDIKVIKKYL